MGNLTEVQVKSPIILTHPHTGGSINAVSYNTVQGHPHTDAGNGLLKAGQPSESERPAQSN